jgi:hypothetical protein
MAHVTVTFHQRRTEMLTAKTSELEPDAGLVRH